MTTTLYRAADHDTLLGGESFSDDLATAKLYLDNPGFGGAHLYSVDADESRALDARDSGHPVARAIRRAADESGLPACEIIHVPGGPNLIDAAARAGYQWILVDESYGEGTTWVATGCDIDGVEDEMTQIL